MSADQEKTSHVPPLTTFMSSDGRTRTDVWHAGTDVETTLVDPYAFLEDPENPDTIGWLAEQAQKTEAFFDSIDPEIKARVDASVEHAFNYEVSPSLNQIGKFIYQKRRGPHNNQPIIYRYAEDEDIGSEGAPILDPNQIDASGTVSINWYYPSFDGTRIAYVQSNRTDGTHILRIRDTATGRDLDEKIPYAHYAYVSWLPDSSGFYYNFYPNEKKIPKGDPRLTQAAYFHTCNTPVQLDTPTIQASGSDLGSAYVFTHQTEPYTFEGITSQDGIKMMSIAASQPTYDEHAFVEIFNSDENIINYVGLTEGILYAIHKQPGHDNKLMRLNLSNGLPANLKDLWEQVDLGETDVLEAAQFIGGKLVVNYLHDVQSRISIIDLKTGEKSDLTIPPMCSATIDGSDTSNIAHLSIETFITPPTLYRVDIATGKMEVVQEKSKPYQETDFSTKQVTYKSADGTLVPMFIVQRKDAKKGVPQKTLIHAYGGFGRCKKPAYDPSLASLVEQGYILAVPGIRGGGEYGKPWHDAGKKQRRKNTYDDLRAARKYMLEQGLTTTEQLAFWGRSNGGLLAATTLIQDPEKWGAVIVQAPVDPINSVKEGLGKIWSEEFGDLKNLEDFKFLLANSPFQNIRQDTAYPSTLVMTGSGDDTVPPDHAYRFAAALQAAQRGQNPTIMYVNAGMHGQENSRSITQEEAVVKQLFLERTLSVH